MLVCRVPHNPHGMNRFIFGLLALLALGSTVEAQQTLPPNTVVGRLGIGPGPSQAIPFATFQNAIAPGLFGLTSRGDANYTILATDYSIVTNAALTAPRTWTLPAAATVTNGKSICVYDSFGGVSATNTLTVVRAGTDTISGATSTVLDSAFYIACFTSDGSSKWTVEKQPLIPTFLQSGTGAVQRSVDSKLKTGEVDLSDFGPVADVVNTTRTTSITTGTGALTVGVALFSSADCTGGVGCTGTVNKAITVQGAGAAGAPYVGTITAFTSSTAVTVSPNAGTTLAAVANTNITYGTDNATKIQQWLTECTSTNRTCVHDGGNYLFASTISMSTTTAVIKGSGRQSAVFWPIHQGNAFNFTTNNPVTLHSFSIFANSTAGTTGTVVAIAGTGGGQNFGSVINDMYITGGNTSLTCNPCALFSIDNSNLSNAINNGIVLGNTNIPLSGVYTISNTNIGLKQTASVRQTCITLQSGGNFQLVNSNVHFCNTALNVQPNVDITIGNILIANNIFEQNDNNGITFSKGSATTFAAETIVITGNEFGGGTPNGIILGADANTNYLRDIAITGNNFYPNGGIAITMTNATQIGNVSVTGNLFASGGGTPTGLNVSGNAVIGTAVGNTYRSLTNNIVNASPKFRAENFVNGHAGMVGVAPTLTAGCNGAGSSVTGTDVHGRVVGQTAAATTCTLTFAQGYAVAPQCVVTGLTAPLTGAVAITTTTLVVNFGSVANFNFTYNCLGT